jgi:hypothetical protein
MTDTPMSYKDVLDLLMLEEPEPTYEALLRWTKRFPQYGRELADFFATWAVQAERPEDPVALDEDKLVDIGVRYALDITRRQGRVAAPSPTEPLQPIDQLVLTAIHLLGEKAWIATIVDKVSEIRGTPTRFAPVFSSLQRLQDRRFVSIRFDNRMPRRIGNEEGSSPYFARELSNLARMLAASSIGR